MSQIMQSDASWNQPNQNRRSETPTNRFEIKNRWLQKQPNQTSVYKNVK